MKYAIFIVTFLMSFLNSGFAHEEKNPYSVRVNLEPESLSITKEGIRFTTKSSQATFITNVHHDLNGLYTIYEVKFTCNDCNLKYVQPVKTCKCGSTNVKLESADSVRTDTHLVDELNSNLPTNLTISKEQELQRRITELETINNQLYAELDKLDKLLKKIGFDDGIETVRLAAEEVLDSNR